MLFIYMGVINLFLFCTILGILLFIFSLICPFLNIKEKTKNEIADFILWICKVIIILIGIKTLFI